jgi:hypothetical protein
VEIDYHKDESLWVVNAQQGAES